MMPRTKSLLLLLVFAGLAAGAPVFEFGGQRFSFSATGDDAGGRFTLLPSDEEIAESHIVTSVGGAGNNVNANIGADRFYNAGFTGQNSVTANVEAGHIWSGHETLGHVTNFVHDPTAFDDPGTAGMQQADLTDRHATWVGAHIGGRLGGAVQGERQRGIAYNTDLRSGAIATTWAGSAYALSFGISGVTIDEAFRAFFGTADVVNSSWGFIDASGTSALTLFIDAFSDQNTSTTFVASAGNSGPGSNTVGSPGSGYNAITVGALQNDGSNNYDSVANFSSRGPQDWSGGGMSCMAPCRAAVDIAAPGTGLTSAFFGGQGGGNNSTLLGSATSGTPASYTNGLNGTSFAAPITAGASALLYSASRNTASLAGVSESRDARVVKAVLMNSADKIPGWTNNQMLNGGIIETTQSLDTASGAGALNLDAAFDQYVNATTKSVAGMSSGNQGSVGLSGFDLGEVTLGTDNVYMISQPIENGTTMNVTLTWFRDRSENAPGGSGTLSDNAQADLDLFIRNTNTNQIVAQSISMLNVAEHLSFTVPSTGLYQIEVKLDSFIFDNNMVPLTTEQYGLAWTAVPEPSAYLFMGLASVSVGLVQTLRKRLSPAKG